MTQQSPTRRPDLLVLIVDHDAETREMYAEMLEYSGMRVVESASAEDAFEKAEKLRPDVITTGIRLQGDIDGCGLCERLKNADRTSSIPVIAVTAWALGGHLERARHAGCDAVLVKPCAPATLIAEIYRVLNRRPRIAGDDVPDPFQLD